MLVTKTEQKATTLEFNVKYWCIVLGVLGVIAAAALIFGVVCFTEKLSVSSPTLQGGIDMTGHTIDNAKSITWGDGSSRFLGATSSGFPRTGTFNLGDVVTTYDGNLWICTTAGSPGQWKTIKPTLTTQDTLSVSGLNSTLSATRLLGIGSLSSSLSGILSGDCIFDTSGDIWIYSTSWKNMTSQLNNTHANIFTSQFTATSVTSQTISVAGARHVGSSASGAPTTGTCQTGDFCVDLTGNIWVFGSAWQSIGFSNRFISLSGGSINGDLLCSGTVNIGSAQQPFADLFCSSALSNQITGTLQTSTQNQITSLGNLTQLTVTGSVMLPASGLDNLTFVSSQTLSCLGISGSQVNSRWLAVTASGAPSSGTFQVGDWSIDQSGNFWIFSTGNLWRGINASGAFLPLSGGQISGNISPSTSGFVNIGSTGNPFINLYATNLYGSVLTSSQPYIVSLQALQTLNGISVGSDSLGAFTLTGSITLASATISIGSSSQAVSNFFTTTLNSSTLSGVLQTASQTSITSVGTLVSLSLRGDLTLSLSNITGVNQLSTQLCSASGYFSGSVATRFLGGNNLTAPTGATFAAGDFVIDQSNNIWVYTGSSVWQQINTTASYLSLSGGVLSGNLLPNSTLVNLGSSSNPFGNVYSSWLTGTLMNPAQANINSLGTLTTGTWNATIIAVAYGGTGQSSLPANQLLLGNNTGPVISVTVGINNTMLTGVTGGAPVFSSTPVVTQITLNNSPLAATDAVNKAYVDSIASSLVFKQTCDYATTTNLTATYNNGSSGVGATLTNNGVLGALLCDGSYPTVGLRILVLFQTVAAQNGIYQVTNAGSSSVAWVLTRTSDYNQVSQILSGDLIPVQSGSNYNGTTWLETAVVNTLGTDNISFTQFSY